MSEPLPEFVVRFNEIVKESENFLSIARDSELQRSACNALQKTLIDIACEKEIAVSKSNEQYAIREFRNDPG